MHKHSQQENLLVYLLAILLISVSVRVAVAFARGDTVVELSGSFDQISYHNLALRVIGGHRFSFGELWWPITPSNAPIAHWSFLYTLYLALVYSLFGPHPIIKRAFYRRSLLTFFIPILHIALEKNCSREYRSGRSGIDDRAILYHSHPFHVVLRCATF